MVAALRRLEGSVPAGDEQTAVARRVLEAALSKSKMSVLGMLSLGLNLYPQVDPTSTID